MALKSRNGLGTRPFAVARDREPLLCYSGGAIAKVELKFLTGGEYDDA